MTLLFAFLVYSVLLSFALSRHGFRGATDAASFDAGPSPARVLIIGATGGTGRALVAQALERGLIVTAFVRRPDRISVTHPNLRVVTGDVLDARSVDAAIRDQDAVVSALGHSRYLGPSRILSEGTRNVLAAMERHRVRRFVCETSLGIGDTAGRMGLSYTFFVIPVVLPFYFWDKTRQERLIAASGIDWVIVRPAVLTNGERRGTGQHGPHVGGFVRTCRVARGDVADFMLNQLTSNTYLRRAAGIAS